MADLESPPVVKEVVPCSSSGLSKDTGEHLAFNPETFKGILKTFSFAFGCDHLLSKSSESRIWI